MRKGVRSQGSGVRKKGSVTAAKAPAPQPPADILGGDVLGNAWEDTLSRSMLPTEVEGTLGEAAAGNLEQQVQLFSSMLDTWAKLGDNDRLLGDCVVGAPWDVRPCACDGEVSEEAEARAKLVEEALRGMRPNPSRTSEMGRDGMLRALMRGNMIGHQVLEVVWERREWEGGTAILPRCVRRAGSQHYGYNGGNRDLLFRPARGGVLTNWPENKFLIHVVAAHDAHPSIAGRWRALAKYWGASTYGFEWLMIFANKFGTPFRFATYADTFTASQRSQLLAMLANLGTAGYGAFPDKTKVEFLEASRSTGELPQPLVMKLADQACDLIYRGEVATSGLDKPTGFSSGAEQGAVRREALQGHCNSVCTTLNQLVSHLMVLNYGDEREKPEIVCEIPEPQDAKANAERDEILLRAGVPVTLEQIQERHDLDAPADGDTVIIQGKLVKWSEDLVSEDFEQKDAKEAKDEEEEESGAPSIPSSQSITAAKAAAPESLTTEQVIERLLNAAVVAGIENFQTAAAEADAREAAESNA